ncbi:hypothetical protein B0H13DRAFT_1904786 [Mycena leptocephala]|nr:hypothetical protein B0H13DRAFT_1904786 [Mycena leptocephala]
MDLGNKIWSGAFNNNIHAFIQGNEGYNIPAALSRAISASRSVSGLSLSTEASDSCVKIEISSRVKIEKSSSSGTSSKVARLGRGGGGSVNIWNDELGVSWRDAVYARKTSEELCGKGSKIEPSSVELLLIESWRKFGCLRVKTRRKMAFLGSPSVPGWLQIVLAWPRAESRRETRRDDKRRGDVTLDYIKMRFTTHEHPSFLRSGSQGYSIQLTSGEEILALMAKPHGGRSRRPHRGAEVFDFAPISRADQFQRLLDRMPLYHPIDFKLDWELVVRNIQTKCLQTRDPPFQRTFPWNFVCEENIKYCKAACYSSGLAP